ncbi:MAG: ATP-binding protein [Deltaproteobacteria bacterium]|nr:ATP-binding protein [Deltaproteobacteria bacterium]
MSRPTSLTLRNFAHLREVTLELGDLTVLVGAQGTGKSLALQWLKVALDGKQVVRALKDAGHHTADPAVLIDLIFGVGMGVAWRKDSAIELQGKAIRPEKIGRLGNGTESVFFIPAHRSMLISDGWAAPFQKLTADTPVVARIFSQNLYDRFSANGSDKLFPQQGMLKQEYRELIDRAIFHKGSIALEQDAQHAKRLKLTYGAAKLPFMTWTAGQREFTPLLLGLYHLLTRTKQRKRPEIDWVIVEEPEMGLHPQALTVFLLLVLDLLWRDYRVVLSTHSPHVLTAVWALQRLKAHHARPELLCDAFDVKATAAMRSVAKAALGKRYKVHLLAFDADDQVTAKDISGLSPEAEDEAESGWGGLTGFSSRFGDAVRRAVNESER